MTKRILYATEVPYGKSKCLSFLWENNFNVLYSRNTEKCIKEIYESFRMVLLLEIHSKEDFTFNIFNSIFEKEYDVPTVVVYKKNVLSTLELKQTNSKLFFIEYPFDKKTFLKTVNEAMSSLIFADKVVKTILDLPEDLIELFIHKEIGQSLTSSLEFETVRRSIVKTAIKLLNSQEGALWLCDDKNKEILEASYSYSLTSQHDGSVRIVNIGEGFVGKSAKEKNSRLIEDPAKYPAFDPSVDVIGNPEIKSMILIPLWFRGELMGVLQLVNKRNQEVFTSKDLIITASLGDYASIALKNAQIYQKTQELTITDDHSSLYNYRFLEKTLEKFFDSAKRYKRNLSLIFMDLDNLKHVNDNYGHLMGSKVLSEVADLILPIIRSADLAVRYGGDEFVVMLPDTDSHGALILAERLKDCIQENTFLRFENLNIKITGSFGVATYPDHAKTKDELLKAADSAMYEAKKISKNRVCISSISKETEGN